MWTTYTRKHTQTCSCILVLPITVTSPWRQSLANPFPAATPKGKPGNSNLHARQLLASVSCPQPNENLPQKDYPVQRTLIIVILKTGCCSRLNSRCNYLTRQRPSGEDTLKDLYIQGATGTQKHFTQTVIKGLHPDMPSKRWNAAEPNLKLTAQLLNPHPF